MGEQAARRPTLSRQFLTCISMGSCSDYSGRCAVAGIFLDRSSLHWEEILGQLPAGAASIISSPTHLIHLPQVARQYRHDWRNIVIFSSGGPLSRETALQIAEVCGQAPIEVLGSTETGGIAFRQQTLWPGLALAPASRCDESVCKRDYWKCVRRFCQSQQPGCALAIVPNSSMSSDSICGDVLTRW